MSETQHTFFYCVILAELAFLEHALTKRASPEVFGFIFTALAFIIFGGWLWRTIRNRNE